MPKNNSNPLITVTLREAEGTAAWSQLWSWLLAEPEENKSADSLLARRRSESRSDEEEGQANVNG